MKHLCAWKKDLGADSRGIQRTHKNYDRIPSVFLRRQNKYSKITKTDRYYVITQRPPFNGMTTAAPQIWCPGLTKHIQANGDNCNPCKVRGRNI